MGCPAEYSRQAGLILRSPYFYRNPPEDLSDKYLRLFMSDQDRELRALREALQGVDSFDKLTGGVQIIYAKALAAMPAGWTDVTDH